MIKKFLIKCIDIQVAMPVKDSDDQSLSDGASNKVAMPVKDSVVQSLACGASNKVAMPVKDSVVQSQCHA